MKKRFGPILFIAVLLLATLSSSVFMVDQTQQAILVQLGKPKDGISEPGLHFKIPFIQEVILFESRVLDYDTRPAEILTEDKKNLIVDNYAKWKIINPLKFYKTVRNVQGAYSRLDDIIYAELRVELGRHIMIEIISSKREEIMQKVTAASDKAARDYGISVIDVRIKRADLPKENERAVFGRMRTERERQAKKYRSEGQEQALKIRAEADRERTVILAEAYRKAQELKGLGDAEATKIYAEAFNQDPDFFNFIRSLDSYRKSLDHKTTVVLSNKEEYLEFTRNSGAELKPPLVEKPIVMPEVAEDGRIDNEPPIKLEALEPSDEPGDAPSLETLEPAPEAAPEPTPETVPEETPSVEDNQG